MTAWCGNNLQKSFANNGCSIFYEKNYKTNVNKYLCLSVQNLNIDPPELKKMFRYLHFDSYFYTAIMT